MKEARLDWLDRTFARLQAVKRRYDPDNLFRSNLNIPPETSPAV